MSALNYITLYFPPTSYLFIVLSFVKCIIFGKIKYINLQVVVKEVPVAYEVERVIEKIVEKEIPVYIEQIVMRYAALEVLLCRK
jgi:hypothetical protein